MPETFDILVATAFGLESVVARELADLGYDAKGQGTGRVAFRGDALAIARSNIRLRTAGRVLIRVAQFECRDFDTLFETTKAFPWEQWIPKDFAFPVNGRSVKSQLSSVPACQRTVKKGIVERLMKGHRVTELPETGPMVTIEIALLNDIATITLDTSGVGMNKRGYRPRVGEAALKETLAAGLVLLSVWRPDRPLIDPFCGTGTIAIEAAMIARNIAPGILREYDAERWPRLDAKAWLDAREEARSLPRGELKHTIHASDIDERALAIARESAKNAGVERDIHFQKRDFADLTSKAEYGVIITNPPYGERLSDPADVERLNASMPGVFRRLPTWSFHVLTARLDLEEVLGQRATRRRKLYNSTIECTYFSFLGPRPPDENERGDRGGEHEERREDMNTGEEPEADVPSGGAEAASSQSAPATGSSSASLLFSPRPPRSIDSPLFSASVLRDRDEKEAAEFEARLAKNARHLRRYPERGIHCYRVYERDCPDVPLIVDIYEDHAHAAEYEREHSRTLAQQSAWWSLMRATIARVLEIPEKHVHTKEKRRQRGLTQHEKQGDTGHAMLVREGGLKFEVNLDDYIDTGLFLDHRLTRAMVRDQARGARFLNLFCYTGAFTAYAVAGGAQSSTSVDLSNTYLDWARRNLRHNGLDSPRHGFIREDALEFLRTHRLTPGGAYDLVVVDPPTFSNSKSTEEDWEVAVGHAELFRLLTPLLSPSATIYFSTNFRRFKLDEETLGGLGLRAREISRQTVPPEYRNDRIHRCWRVQRA